MKRMLVVFAALVAVGMCWGVKSDAALCPAAGLGTICADFTEGGGTGITMQSTTVVISRDGVALPAVVVPASSAAGKQTRFTSLPTQECQSDTYTATAQSNYLVGTTPFQSLVVSTAPGVLVTKDRTAEPVCVAPPSNFSLH